MIWHTVSVFTCTTCIYVVCAVRATCDEAAVDMCLKIYLLMCLIDCCVNFEIDNYRNTGSIPHQFDDLMFSRFFPFYCSIYLQLLIVESIYVQTRLISVHLYVKHACRVPTNGSLNYMLSYSKIHRYHYCPRKPLRSLFCRLIQKTNKHGTSMQFWGVSTFGARGVVAWLFLMDWSVVSCSDGRLRRCLGYNSLASWCGRVCSTIPCTCWVRVEKIRSIGIRHCKKLQITHVERS